MSDAGEATSPDEGGMAALFDYLPAGWRDRLTGFVDLEAVQLDWLGSESARVGGNLLVLLERGWPEMAALGGGLALFAVGGTFVVGAASAILAWLLYLILAGPLLRRGWGTGRAVGCFVATAVVLCAGVGGAWGGLWLGVGRATQTAIEQRYVIERLAAATFLAFTLEEGELPQGVDADTVDELLGRAQRRSADSWASFRARAEAAGTDAGEEQAGWLRPEMITGVVERLGSGAAPDLLALHRVLSTPAAADGEDRLPQTAGIRARAVELLRGTVYTQAATGLGFGLVLPLLGLVLLALAGFLFRRDSTPPPSG